MLLSEFIVCTLTVILGNLFHFAYERSGKNRFIGFLFPVSESTWEHLKLIFFPYLLCSLFQRILTPICGFWAAKCAGVIIGMIVTVTIFYTYTKILKKNILIFDILSFVIGVYTSGAIFLHCIKNYNLCQGALPIILYGLCLLLVLLFIVFTYNPPSTSFFQPPEEVHNNLK